MTDQADPLTSLATGLSSDQLRAEVRAVLREVLPAVLTGRAGGAGATAGTVGGAVRLADDADLDAFVRRLAALCDDPGQRAALREGRHVFRFAGTGETLPAPATAPAPVPPARDSPQVVRVEHGAVTERIVAKAAARSARLVLGRRAVLTPLARDKARTLGVDVEREH